MHIMLNRCPPPFAGDKRCSNTSLDDCSGSNFCYNGGVCRVEQSGFHRCHCPLGFSGGSYIIYRSLPSDRQMGLASQHLCTNMQLGQAGRLSKYHCSVNKAHGHAVFKNNLKALRGCADQTVDLNTRGSVSFACLSGQSYLSSGERSIANIAMKMFISLTLCSMK